MADRYNGVLLVDKPKGFGSRQVDRKIAHHLDISKVGHVGTLDPLATGLLVILLGEGTKLSQFLVGARKRYQATFKLGVQTDTYDIDGQVVAEKAWDYVAPEEVHQAVHSFLGRSMQVPPAFSAIKVDGVANYKRARRGEAVELEPRPVEIGSIAVTRLDLPDVSIDVLCSKGTYLRSLVHDIGNLLGCGAVLTEIRRVESEPFHLMHATSLEPLLETDPEQVGRLVIPIEEALGHLRTVRASAALDARLQVGNLPLRQDMGPLLETDFLADDLIVVVGSSRIAILKAETDARSARSHPRPVSYVRILERG